MPRLQWNQRLSYRVGIMSAVGTFCGSWHIKISSPPLKAKIETRSSKVKSSTSNANSFIRYKLPKWKLLKCHWTRIKHKFDDNWSELMFHSYFSSSSTRIFNIRTFFLQQDIGENQIHANKGEIFWLQEEIKPCRNYDSINNHLHISKLLSNLLKRTVKLSVSSS